MSLKDLLTRQGKHLVVRDTDTGRIARNDDGTLKHVVDAPRGVKYDKKAQKETFRQGLKRLTNNGMDGLERLARISRGEILIPVGIDPLTGDKLKGEPLVPSIESQRAAIMDIHQILHGKAVSETDVNEAEKQAETRASLEAMSEDDLRRIIEGEVVSSKELPSGEEPE